MNWKHFYEVVLKDNFFKNPFENKHYPTEEMAKRRAQWLRERCGLSFSDVVVDVLYAPTDNPLKVKFL